MKTATQLSILILTFGLSTSAIAAGNSSVTASVNATTVASVSAMSVINSGTTSATQEILTEMKSHISQTIKANLVELKESTKATLIKSFTPEQEKAQQTSGKEQ